MKSPDIDECRDTKDGLDRRTVLKYGAAFAGTMIMNQFAVKNAEATNIKRMDATGKCRILGCNDMTSTEGYWDNSTKPALTMNSGEIVEIETNTHLKGKMIPGAEIEDWMAWYKEVMAKTPDASFYPDAKTGVQAAKKGAGHHTLTGPIFVNGAEPGDMLQIEILDIIPGNYGFNLNPETSFVKLGLLPDDFPKGRLTWYEVDQKNMKFEFLPGIEIPVRPFPGTIGVELPEKGMWSNVPPGKHGGNMDNKELVAGSVLYLPVHVQGAGLKSGDAHYAQGDGEVNLNALEGAFKSMKLRIAVRKDLKGLVQEPFASTPTHWIAMGFHTDMLESTKMAVRNAIKFLNKRYGMNELDSYAFCSMAVDLRVTQVVDLAKGIHAMIPKNYFVGDQYAKKTTLLL
jgi:acetamidase/formamidase